MYRVDVNAKVGIVKSAGVCTFETLCFVERLKIALGESGTGGEALWEVRKVPGAKNKLWCILNKDCG
jgi:hypothetical protein